MWLTGLPTILICFQVLAKSDKSLVFKNAYDDNRANKRLQEGDKLDGHVVATHIHQ